jgi:hypothetical protein
MKTKPKFETNADATLDRVRATYSQRGGEYADTWGTCRFPVMTSVAKELGISISPQYFRALASAALCDMKNERMTGGWKEDNMIDGIAYDAFLVEEMRLLKAHSEEWVDLNVGEMARGGDQFFNTPAGKWEDLNIAAAGSGYVVTEKFRCRRKVKVPAIMREPDGMGGADKWRLLDIGEPLKKGDEYHDGDAWRQTKHIGIAASCGNAYRRLIS